METVLVVGSLAVAALALAAVVAIPILIVGALLWLITLPLRLLFKVVFGLVGALLGLIAGPILLLVSGLALAGAAAGAAFSPDLPIVPLLLVAFGSWALYRVSRPRVA